jgi:hypothetical protein
VWLCLCALSLTLAQIGILSYDKNKRRSVADNYTKSQATILSLFTSIKSNSQSRGGGYSNYEVPTFYLKLNDAQATQNAVVSESLDLDAYLENPKYYDSLKSGDKIDIYIPNGTANEPFRLAANLDKQADFFGGVRLTIVIISVIATPFVFYYTIKKPKSLS